MTPPRPGDSRRRPDLERRPGRRPWRWRDERGSVSVWVVLIAPAMIVLAGLAVDGAGKVHADQRAVNVAAQAARVAGQQLQPGDAIRGIRAVPDTARAAAAARTYLTSAGVTGHVSTHGGDTIRVTVTDTYDPVFLTIIGIDQFQVTGDAEARTVRALNGTER